MLKKTDHLKTGDQLAIDQEYREWIKCIKNKDLVPQNILFINTSNFGENNQYEEFLSSYLEKFLNVFSSHVYKQIILIGMKSTIK